MKNVDETWNIYRYESLNPCPFLTNIPSLSPLVPSVGNPSSTTAFVTQSSVYVYLASAVRKHMNKQIRQNVILKNLRASVPVSVLYN